MDVDVLMGTIELFSFPFAPSGWMTCEGQTMVIAQNSALYSLLGTSFGGNATTNFLLPNLTGASPDPKMKYYIAITGIYPSRS